MHWEAITKVTIVKVTKSVKRTATRSRGTIITVKMSKKTKYNK